MRIIREFDVHRPAIAQTILHLSGNLLVGEIGQKRKAALGHAHDPVPYIETLAVGA
jgi:hypothetical protein